MAVDVTKIQEIQASIESLDKELQAKNAEISEKKFELGRLVRALLSESDIEIPVVYTNNRKRGTASTVKVPKEEKKAVLIKLITDAGGTISYVDLAKQFCDKTGAKKLLVRESEYSTIGIQVDDDRNYSLV